VFEDPVLAVDLGRTAPLRPSVLALTAFRLDGRPFSPSSQWAGGPAYRVTVRADTVLCEVPCGFGFQEGRYELVATVPGFLPADLTVEARYDDFDGGCPSSNAGSTRVTVDLTPAS